MPKYNHAFDVAFEVVSDTEDGSDVTPEMFKEAMLKRIANLDSEGTWSEACGKPFDTYLVEGEPDQSESAS